MRGASLPQSPREAHSLAPHNTRTGRPGRELVAHRHSTARLYPILLFSPRTANIKRVGERLSVEAYGCGKGQSRRAASGLHGEGRREDLG